MIIYANPDHARHAGRHEMYRGRLVPCHEVPARLDQVLAELARRPLGELRTPQPLPAGLLERVHAAPYLRFLQQAWDDWVALDPANAERDLLPSVWPARGLRTDREPDNLSARLGLYAFDAGTPITAGTWGAALAGAACAADAARALLHEPAARAALALTRPPGHHAAHDLFGGYCFLNNAAIAAQTLRDGGVPRVAIVDIDYHHGNGTQSLFYTRDDVLTVSLHGDPRTEYPFYLGHADETGSGRGMGCNLNLPLPAGTGFDAWRRALRTGLERVAGFGADAVVVALGVDTFEHDPISRFRLRSDDYREIGRDLAALGRPTVFTLEGGYAVQAMGINVVNVLEGFGG